MTDPCMCPPEQDARYYPVRHNEYPHVWKPFASLAEWEGRADWLRRRNACVLGLWPEPERCPLNMRTTGRLEYDDYTIDNVYFESWPGFYCTGNLYRPRNLSGRVPGVLHPHGHWLKGRLEHQEQTSVRSRCITMARMGMVSFSYDMVGYNDSLQVPSHAAHSLRGSLWGLTNLALQTWNSLRAVDLLLELPEVDPERLGCTGASGGGTQTFILTALDTRIKVSAPVNMISAMAQGGCFCENAPGLRTQTFNVEIAALMAPRALLLVSTRQDWTVNTPLVEYPAIRSVYELYGVPERVAQAQFDAPHNYNADSRQAVYRWFARWLLDNEALGIDAEREFDVEPDERMRVFPTGQLPIGAPDAEQVQAAFVQRAQERLSALMPRTPDQFEHLRQVTTIRLQEALEASWPDPTNVVACEEAPSTEQGDGATQVILARDGVAERIPGTLYEPVAGAGARRYVLLVHGAGRIALEDRYGRAGEAIATLRAAGWGVLAIDAFYAGVVPPDAKPWRRDWFWMTYVPTLLGQRVQDLLVALAWLSTKAAPDGLAVVGLGAAGAWALLAAALCPTSGPTGPGLRLCADLRGINVDDDTDLLGELFAPNLRAYGDWRAAAALAAPRELTLIGAHRRIVEWAEAAYGVAGVPQALRCVEAPTTALQSALDALR